MKPPKKIYAKVEIRNGEEILRLSTSPFSRGNIIYWNDAFVKKRVKEKFNEIKEKLNEKKIN